MIIDCNHAGVDFQFCSRRLPFMVFFDSYKYTIPPFCLFVIKRMTRKTAKTKMTMMMTMMMMMMMMMMMTKFNDGDSGAGSDYNDPRDSLDKKVNPIRFS